MLIAPASPRSLLPVAVLAVIACGPNVVSTTGTQESASSSSGATQALSDDSTTSTAAADETSSSGSGSSGEAFSGWCLTVQNPPFPGSNAGPPVHADVDGDGRPELWLRPLVDGEIHWQALSQEPDGTFSITQGGTTSDLVMRRIADVDGDGRDDLILTRTSFPRDSLWRAGMPDRTFDATEHPLPDTEGAFGDLDGDGLVDRMVEVGRSEFRVELGLGDGTFWPLAGTINPGYAPVVIDSVGVPGQFAVFADDGGIALPAYVVRVFRFDSSYDIALLANSNFGASDPWGVLDLDGDGLVDLVIEELAQLDRALYLARGRTDGAFTPEPLDDPGGLREGAVGDFDGDGLHDVLWWKSLEDQVWFRPGVPGGFGDLLPVQGAELLEVHETAVRAIDYDGDGRATWMTRHGSELMHAIDLQPCPG